MDKPAIEFRRNADGTLAITMTDPQEDGSTIVTWAPRCTIESIQHDGGGVDIPVSFDVFGFGDFTNAKKYKLNPITAFDIKIEE